MGEGGGERAASSAYAGLSLARQPAIWIGCSGALGSAGFAALRVAEIIACARGSERFPCAWVLSLGKTQCRDCSRPCRRLLQGVVWEEKQRASGLLPCVQTTWSVSARSDENAGTCRKLQEARTPAFVSACYLFGVGHFSRRLRKRVRSSTCSPAYRPPAAPPAVIMCAVSREGGGWRGRARVPSRMCVCGDATHALRDEAKDEGGLVASAGHLPCRPKVRAFSVFHGEGFVSEEGVCSGGGIRGCSKCASEGRGG